MKALTLKPTWAWFVVNGYKDIENRSWSTKVRGKIYIHAASSPVTKPQYENFVHNCGVMRIKNVPAREKIPCGGIVGSVEIIDCVTKSRSKWFRGPYGFVLKNARKSKFKPLKGRLGFFDV